MERIGIVIIMSILIGSTGWGGITAEAQDVGSLVPRQELPSGWELVHGPKTYTGRTLFEHINGQAELFMKYGFQKSAFAILQNRSAPGDQMELDIYDMMNGLQAFGIFSRFRSEDRPGGFGVDSYLDDHSALFYKGRYFVLLYATERQASLLKQIATTVSQKIQDRSLPPAEIAFFPKDGLRFHSIQYFPEGLLGHQFLGRGFIARYSEKAPPEEKSLSEAEKKEPQEFQLFLALFRNSQEAKRASVSYKEYISRKGAVQEAIQNDFATPAWSGEDPYQGKVLVLQKNGYLMGAVGVKSPLAEIRLKELAKNLK